MEYIINQILDQIRSSKPDDNNESIIIINGFENLDFYNTLGTRILDLFSHSNTKVNIKIGTAKWKELKENSNTTTINSILNKGWVSEDESITYYRNLHQSNLLVLMATEEESDVSGLKNCFTITPNSMLDSLKSRYIAVLEPCFTCELNRDDRDAVNKLYKNLFEYIPADICKLSDQADNWNNCFSTLDDFLTEFSANLTSWGLQNRIEVPLKPKQLKSKRGNVFKSQYKFINRKLYDPISDSKLKKLRKQLDEYDIGEGTYGGSWDGWKDQGFESYKDFTTCLIDFLSGKSINANRNKLMELDYSIIDDVLSPKEKGASPKHPEKDDKSIGGDPLNVFLNALISMLKKASEAEVDYLESISFNFIEASIVTGFTDSGKSADSDKEEILRKVWKNICLHTNGILSFINGNSWKYKDNLIHLDTKTPNFFNLDPAEGPVAEMVSPARNTNTTNCISFTVQGRDEQGNVIKVINPETGRKKNLEMTWTWKFKNDEPWLYEFKDILSESFQDSLESPLIPFGQTKQITALAMCKSAEEFFDVLEDTAVDYSENILDLVKQNNSSHHYSTEIAEIPAYFAQLAQTFTTFANYLSRSGIYSMFTDKYSDYSNALIEAYKSLAEYIRSCPIRNCLSLTDLFINAFCVAEDISFLTKQINAECLIIPTWHPAALQKWADQKRFITDGIYSQWSAYNEKLINGDRDDHFSVGSSIDRLYRLTELQSSLDLFPGLGNTYIGCLATFGTFSIFGSSDCLKKGSLRLRDIIKKEAIYDADFSKISLKRLSDDAVMILDVLEDYIKAVPHSRNNLNLLFLDPSDLQPIVAAVQKFAENQKKIYSDEVIHINLSILVRPENKGGRNYLAYWMENYFSQDDSVHLKTSLNIWNNIDQLKNLVKSNTDIAFNMNVLQDQSFQFEQYEKSDTLKMQECRFPIVYKPYPADPGSTRRAIEITQPQFSAAMEHSQIVYYRTHSETIPNHLYTVTREAFVTDECREVLDLLHENSYWVVCIDRLLDGALIQSGKTKYNIIGFSTGKGTYGQYNVTITARDSIVESIQSAFKRRLRQMFHWEKDVLDQVCSRIISEASSLDGISLLSAMNLNDYNINEFMAYVLTAIREKENENNHFLKMIIHLDSYKHWFQKSLRPDFLIVTVSENEGKVQLHATVTECKIASLNTAADHIDKAQKQVRSGISQLQEIFNPDSTSQNRRYWLSQLYRALVFSQVTFPQTNNSNALDPAFIAKQLKKVLEGDFQIEWDKQILGYWLDSDEELESKEITDDGISIYNIPQIRIRQLLTENADGVFQDIQDVDSYLKDEKQHNENEEQYIKNLDDEVSELYSRSNPVESVDYIDNELPDDFALLDKSEETDWVIPSKSEDQNTSEKELDEVKFKDHSIEDKDDSYKVSAEEQEINEPLSDIDQPVSEDDSLNPETSIPLQDTRILIGKDLRKNPVYWEFGNKLLSNRHLLITGTSGQGKTYCIQTLLYELSKSNVSAVIVDYTDGFMRHQLQDKFLKKMDGKIEEQIVIVNGVPINPFKKHDVIINSNLVIPEGDTEIAGRISEILGKSFKLGLQQQNSVYTACMNGLSRYGSQMTMTLLRQELEDLGTSYAKGALSRMVQFFDGVKFTNEDFDWGKILYSDTSTTLIFQLTTLSRDRQVAVTEFLLWDLWYYSKKYGSESKPFVVVLDEAQNLSHGKNSPCAVIQTEGRKFGWSAWFATQSLSVLKDEEITRLEQSGLKLNFKPTENEISTIAKQLDQSNPTAWKQQVQNLKKGQCIVAGGRILQNGKFSYDKPAVTSVLSFEERE